MIAKLPQPKCKTKEYIFHKILIGLGLRGDDNIDLLRKRDK